MIRKIKKDPFRSPFLVEWGGGVNGKNGQENASKIVYAHPQKYQNHIDGGGVKSLVSKTLFLKGLF